MYTTYMHLNTDLTLHITVRLHRLGVYCKSVHFSAHFNFAYTLECKIKMKVKYLFDIEL